MNLRRIIMIMPALLLAFTVAQAQSMDNLFLKYGKKSDFELVSINKTMLTTARMMAGKEAREVLKKVSSMRVLTAETGADRDKFLTEINSLSASHGYETLVEVREKGEHMRILYREISVKQTELLVVHSEKDDLNAVLIKGSLRPDEFEKLNQKMKITRK